MACLMENERAQYWAYLTEFLMDKKMVEWMDIQMDLDSDAMKEFLLDIKMEVVLVLTMGMSLENLMV